MTETALTTTLNNLCETKTDNTALSVQEFRHNIAVMEQKMLGMDNALIGKDSEAHAPVVHSFGDGCYIRQIFMPAGTLLTSKIHKVTHPYFIMTGKASVATEDGIEVLTAPFQGITQAGTKRALYIHEDMVWTTVHVTNETDLNKIEEEIIAKDFDEFDSLVNSSDESLKIEEK